MTGEFPDFYCGCCGKKLVPYWLEGYEGRIRYDELTGKPYKEFKVYYKSSTKWDFWREHSFKMVEIRKLPDSSYRLPESIKDYLVNYGTTG